MYSTYVCSTVNGSCTVYSVVEVVEMFVLL